MEDGSADVAGATLRDLYTVWFRTGWRSNEIVALRFDWLSFSRQIVDLRAGREARFGHEASPKTGRREIELANDPEVFAAFERRRKASLETGQRDYVFADSAGRPISQEWLHKRVWSPTLRLIGAFHRGQYNIRDTFITLALSAARTLGGSPRSAARASR